MKPWKIVNRYCNHKNSLEILHLYQRPAHTSRLGLHVCNPRDMDSVLYPGWMYINPFHTIEHHIRPYQAESSGSRPISTENLFRGQLVVEWVTISESWLLYVFGNFSELRMLGVRFPHRYGGFFFFFLFFEEEGEGLRRHITNTVGPLSIFLSSFTLMYCEQALRLTSRTSCAGATTQAAMDRAITMVLRSMNRIISSRHRFVVRFRDGLLGAGAANMIQRTSVLRKNTIWWRDVAFWDVVYMYLVGWLVGREGLGYVSINSRKYPRISVRIVSSGPFLPGPVSSGPFARSG